MFDHGAAVLGGGDAGFVGPGNAGVVGNARLEPDAAGTGSDGIVDHVIGLVPTDEDIDQVHRDGDVLHALIGLFAEHFIRPFLFWDGDDAVSAGAEVAGNAVGGTFGAVVEPDDSDRAGGEEGLFGGPFVFCGHTVLQRFSSGCRAARMVSRGGRTGVACGRYTVSMDIAVRHEGGNEYEVRLSDNGTERTSHRVTVTPDRLEQYAAGASAETLVRESFAFLLEREPPESILGSFPIETIERYFPEYPAEIGKRLAPG